MLPGPITLLPCQTYEAEAIAALLEEHIKPYLPNLPGQGASILLKPNMVKAIRREKCAQTDPIFLEGVMLWSKARGWKLSIGDSPAIGSAHQAAKVSGLDEVCRRQGVPLVELKGNRVVTSGQATRWVSRSLDDFDGVVNCPKLKGHGQLYFTGAVKNLYGCMKGKRKVWLHMKHGDHRQGQDFAKMLLDHARVVAPVFNILDGIRAMAGPGPISGEPVHEGLMAMGVDPLALDQIVFEHLGGDENSDPIMKLARETGCLEKHPTLLLPLGLPPRGDFYFPGFSDRKPISFRPWVLLRLAWRSACSGLKERGRSYRG